jgi:imidazolonepropionase
VRRGTALHNLGIIEDGSVLIQDGIIAGIGSTRRLENLKEARTAIEIPVNGSIVMPALVDPSLHLSLEATGGVSRHPHKRKKLADFYNEALTLMRGCLQHGTLTVEVKANGEGADLRADISALRQLSRVGNQPIAMFRTWRVSGELVSDSSSAAFKQTLNALSSRQLVDFVELIAEGDQSREDLLLAALQDARVPVKLYWPGGSPSVLSELLARSNPFSISCPSNLTSAECLVLSRFPSIVVLAANREIVEERSNCARELIESGAAIALASGYHAIHAPSFSMQMAIALATLRLGLAPEAAISAATINAAYAVGCGDTTGSLEYGKRADMLVLSVPDYREIPRRFGINHVGIAIRDGNIVLNRTRWRIGN